jgi:flotillin
LLHRINAETAVARTERDGNTAAAEAALKIRQAGLNRDLELKKIEAKQATELMDEDRKKAVEERRAAAETARLRADVVTKATAEREKLQQAADAEAYQIRAKAAADLEAAKSAADAAAYAKRAEAQANLDAMGAEANGLAKIAEALGSTHLALQWVMIDKGVFTDLANANARALNGLNPSISVINTGGDGGSQDTTAPIRQIAQSMQAGLMPPEWMYGSVMPGSPLDKIADKAKQGQINHVAHE